MKHLLQGKTRRAWARMMMEVGPQVAIEAAMARKEPFKGAMAFFKRLEDAAVIRPWVFEVEVTLAGPYEGTTDFFEVLSVREGDDDVDIDVPLYIAGDNWDAFEEAVRSL